jgi:hypothetical protein
MTHPRFVQIHENQIVVNDILFKTTRILNRSAIRLFPIFGLEYRAQERLTFGSNLR